MTQQVENELGIPNDDMSSNVAETKKQVNCMNNKKGRTQESESTKKPRKYWKIKERKRKLHSWDN